MASCRNKGVFMEGSNFRCRRTRKLPEAHLGRCRKNPIYANTDAWDLPVYPARLSTRLAPRVEQTAMVVTAKIKDTFCDKNMRLAKYTAMAAKKVASNRTITRLAGNRFVMVCNGGGTSKVYPVYHLSISLMHNRHVRKLTR